MPTQIKFRIDFSLDIDIKVFIDYVKPKCTECLIVKEIATETLKEHYQGFFIIPEDEKKRGAGGKSFRDSIKNNKYFKKKLKGAGKFSFSSTWGKIPQNPLGMPHSDWYKLYVTKDNDPVWFYNITREQFDKWYVEYNSVDHDKKKTLVKSKKTGKLSINQSIIAYVDAKLQKGVDGSIVGTLTPEIACKHILTWFRKEFKDFDRFILIKKINMLMNHFHPQVTEDRFQKEVMEHYYQSYDF